MMGRGSARSLGEEGQTTSAWQGEEAAQGRAPTRRH